mgnify:CR=1 FL=1
MPSEKVIKIVNDIKKGDIKSVYFLMGEEAYYIDAIADFIQIRFFRKKKKDLIKWFYTVAMFLLMTL